MVGQTFLSALRLGRQECLPHQFWSPLPGNPLAAFAPWPFSAYYLNRDRKRGAVGKRNSGEDLPESGFPEEAIHPFPRPRGAGTLQ